MTYSEFNAVVETLIVNNLYGTIIKFKNDPNIYLMSIIGKHEEKVEYKLSKPLQAWFIYHKRKGKFKPTF